MVFYIEEYCRDVRKGINFLNLNDIKTERVSEMLYYGKAIEHPIVLKYKDKRTNRVYFYLVAGNTRATHIGYGVKVLVLHV